jgi:hypothetical protein
MGELYLDQTKNVSPLNETRLNQSYNNAFYTPAANLNNYKIEDNLPTPTNVPRKIDNGEDTEPPASKALSAINSNIETSPLATGQSVIQKRPSIKTKTLQIDPFKQSYI